MPIQKDVQTLIINKMSKERYEREYAAGNIADDEIVLIPDEDSGATYENATTSSDGLMSKEDKTKLDGIEAGANKYSHPTTSGNKHIPTGGSEGQILKWKSNGEAVWADETDTNTTYENATTSTDGLMSSADKTKLDSIEEGANNYTHPEVEHLPSGGSEGQILKRTADGTASWGTLNATDVNADEAGSADNARASAEEYTNLAVAMKSSVHIHDSEGGQTNLANLKLFPISKEDYESGIANNTLEQNAMYLIPDDGGDNPVADDTDKLNVVIETTDNGKVYNIVNDTGTVIASIDDNGVHASDLSVLSGNSQISVKEFFAAIDNTKINDKALGDGDIELTASDIKTSSDNTVQYVLTNHADSLNRFSSNISNNEARFFPKTSWTKTFDPAEPSVNIFEINAGDVGVVFGNWYGILAFKCGNTTLGSYLINIIANEGGVNTCTIQQLCAPSLSGTATFNIAIYGNQNRIIIEVISSIGSDITCGCHTLSCSNNCLYGNSSTITIPDNLPELTRLNTTSGAQPPIIYGYALNAVHDEKGNMIHSTYFSNENGPIKTGNGVASVILGSVSRNYADGHYSTVTGRNNMAYNEGEFVSGKFNSDSLNSGNLFIIGNGTPSSRDNAARITDTGAMYIKGALTPNGADYAEYFEWIDTNQNNEDRRGYFVTMEGDKIRIAKPNDYILGIVSSNPSIIGNGDECWTGRYILDEFGSYIIETYDYDEVIEEKVFDVNTNEVTSVTKTVRKTGLRYKENPDYDPTRQYIQRKDRPEWAAVGMMGVLHVRDDGTCKVNGFCTVSDNGTATTSESGYRVIARTSENIIKVILK